MPEALVGDPLAAAAQAFARNDRSQISHYGYLGGAVVQNKPGDGKQVLLIYEDDPFYSPLDSGFSFHAKYSMLIISNIDFAGKELPHKPYIPTKLYTGFSELIMDKLFEKLLPAVRYSYKLRGSQ